MNPLHKIDRAIKGYSNPFHNSSEIENAQIAIAQFFNKKYAILVSSGTAAIHTALIACDIKKGDEVLVPALAPVMTVAPIIHLHAIPVFVDCEGDSTDLNIQQIAKAITRRTKAIIPVHLWGIPCNMTSIIKLAKKHRFSVIEDACQAHGSRWNGQLAGTFGECGCFSTRSGKLMSTGEGGFIVTDSAKIAQICKTTINHHINRKNPDKSFIKIGFNYRPTEIQAILTVSELEKLNDRIKMRKYANRQLRQKTNKIVGIRPLTTSKLANSNGYCALFLADDKYKPRSVANQLAANEIPNSVGTFGLRPLPKWSSVAQGGRLADVAEGIPNCERLLNRVLAILLNRGGTLQEIEKIAHKIKFLTGKQNAQ